MNCKSVLFATTPLIFSIILAVHFIPIYAANSTQSTYCFNGVCSTGGTPKPVTNSTIGLYAPGLYNGPSGFALKNADRIGIMLSKTCITMEQHHIKSNCPSYDALRIFDNTNPSISGKWINDTWYHRLPPIAKDAYKFYTDKTIIMVDPDGIFASKALLITVVDKNFTWINPDDTSKGGLITLTHINRSVLNCDQATVAPNLWLINDTITYLESGCTKTDYNDTSVAYHKDIPFSYDNPFSTLHYDMAKLKADKHQTQNCLTVKCNVKDPYKKSAWGK